MTTDEDVRGHPMEKKVRICHGDVRPLGLRTSATGLTEPVCSIPESTH